MTVTRVPARNPEPEGLDGRGTTHAADLPATAHTWGHLSVSLEMDTDLDADVPVTRSLCLLVDPEGDYLMPGRCKKPLGHEEPHDWGATHGAFLGEVRRAELAQGGSPPSSGFTQREMEDFSGYVAYAAGAELDTPSDVLPVRVPGEALRDSDEAWEPPEGFTREVIERWPA